MQNAELADQASPMKKPKQNIAELTRLAHILKEKIRTVKKKSQGRKQINETRPAKYHNWHTPFC
jgi:hypothetical protein